MPLTNPSTSALLKANNLSDLASITSAWANLGASQSLGANGWMKLPNGLILQWRTFNGSSQTFNAGSFYFFDILFPISFNTIYACIGSQISGLNTGLSTTFESQTNSKVTATVIYQNTTSTVASFRVFAIGI